MVLNNLFYNSNFVLYVYMFIYNVTLINIFFVLMSSLITNTKTLYSFSNYNFDSFFILSLSISIFSLAGVPPFTGFFSKIFILNVLSNSNFFLLSFIFFIVLLLSLYFYVQNIKFLHSTNQGYSSYSYILNERKSISIHYYSLLVVLFISLGVFVIDDLLFIFIWFLI